MDPNFTSALFWDFTCGVIDSLNVSLRVERITNYSWPHRAGSRVFLIILCNVLSRKCTSLKKRAHGGDEQKEMKKGPSSGSVLGVGLSDVKPVSVTVCIIGNIETSQKGKKFRDYAYAEDKAAEEMVRVRVSGLGVCGLSAAFMKALMLVNKALKNLRPGYIRVTSKL